MNPFTHLLQPTSLDEFIGQKNIVGAGSALYKLIKQKEIPHLFFYGKPGTGKTTLAKIIANEIQTDFYSFNATSIKVDDLRKVFNRYENTLIKPLVFIDEVHRLSKNQQEVLLPVMEKYQAIIIGASTENPYHTLTAAIRSRGFLFEFLSHTKEDLDDLLQKASRSIDIKLTDDIRSYLINSSNGDARAMLNLLEFAYKVDANINLVVLKELRMEFLKNRFSISFLQEC